MSKCHIPEKNASTQLNNSTATTPWVHLTRCAHGVVAVANEGPAGPLGATRPQVKKRKKKTRPRSLGIGLGGGAQKRPIFTNKNPKTA